MKTFLVEHRDFDKPPIRVLLYNPPYEDADVISRTKFKLKDVMITDVTPELQGEE